MDDFPVAWLEKSNAWFLRFFTETDVDLIPDRTGHSEKFIGWYPNRVTAKNEQILDGRWNRQEGHMVIFGRSQSHCQIRKYWGRLIELMQKMIYIVCSHHHISEFLLVKRF